MKNKTGVNLYLYTLRQLTIPAVIMGSICIVASVLNMLNPDLNRPLYSYQRIFSHYFYKFYDGRPIAAAINPALIIFMYAGSAVFTYLAFKHLNSRSSSDFYHSLPYTRMSGFLSRILAVFTLQYGIIIISMGASVVTMTGSGVPFNPSFIPRLTLSFLGGSTLIAGGIALAMSLTGSLAANVMMSLVILVAPRALLFIWDRIIISTNFFGFINVSTMGIFLNPVYNIPTAAILDLTRAWEHYGLSETLINTGAALYSLVLGIIYLGLALFFMTKRKSELAGNGVGTDVMRHVLCSLVSLPFLVYAFSQIISRGVVSFKSPETMQKLAIFAAVSLVVFVVTQFVLKRQVKSILKSIPVFAATAVLAMAIIFMQKETAVKINNRVPDADEIEYIKIDENYSIAEKYRPFYSYTNLMTKQIEYTEESIISILQGNLARTVSAYDAMRKNGDKWAVEYGPRIYCEFKLKNGRSVYRNFLVYDDTVNDLWKSISSNPEYKKLSVAMPPEEEVDDISIYCNLGMDESYKPEFYFLYKSEFESLPTVTKNEAINEQNNSLYSRLFSYYAPNTFYMQLNNFTVSGEIDGYDFRNSYAISSRVPEAAKYYISEVNCAAKEQFFIDVEKIKALEDEGDSYRMWIEVLNFDCGDGASHLGFDFTYDGRYPDGAELGNNIGSDKVFEIFDMIEEKDLIGVNFGAPFTSITISRQDVDPAYYLNYNIYAQLNMEEADKLFETYIDLYN